MTLSAISVTSRCSKQHSYSITPSAPLAHATKSFVASVTNQLSRNAPWRFNHVSYQIIMWRTASRLRARGQK